MECIFDAQINLTILKLPPIAKQLSRPVGLSAWHARLARGRRVHEADNTVDRIQR
jgi:hypothetical protein